MRPLFLLFISCLLSFYNLNAQDQTETRQSLYFASASAELDQTATGQLSLLVEQIQSFGDYRLEIAAHTDSRGSKGYNEQLARERAQSVSDYLEKHQINTDQMQVLAFGERKAGDDLGSEESLQNNRRVDIIISGWMWEDMTAFWDSLANPLVQTFSFDPTKDMLVEGQKGGRFFIPANSMIDAKGDLVTAMVNLQLTECYNIGDMLSLGLTTTAQGKILESGGMFELTATSKGEGTFLKEGESIAASVPTSDFRDGMSMFYGNGHEQQADNLDWIDSEDAVKSSLPQLKMARRPVRPVHETYKIKGRILTEEEIVELTGLKAPAPPSISRPYRPREPDYDRIEYHPRGLDKLFVNKAKRQARTDSMRMKSRNSYTKKLAAFNIRKPVYDAKMAEYRKEIATYEAKKDEIVDEFGEVRVGSYVAVELQRLADLAYEQAMAKYKKTKLAYDAYAKRKVAEYEVQMDALGMIDETSFQRYFMSVNQLGWANIDRFLKSQPRTMLAAQEFANDNNANTKVFLIFPDRNIILQMRGDTNDRYQLSSVPIGEKATVLAVKVENQKVYMANESITISEDMLVDLNYNPARLKDVREELAGM